MTFFVASSLVSLDPWPVYAVASPQDLPIPKFIPKTAGDIEAMRLAAQGGDSEQQFTLCFAYFTGLGGLTADAAQALTWCQKASVQGSETATVLAGLIYDRGGIGVTKDRGEALRWFRQSADRGNPIAQFLLGRAYEVGDVVTRDSTQALLWYRSAAAHGSALADNALGDVFAEGRGVTKDFAEAAIWFRLSADQHNGYGVMKLAELYDKGIGVHRDAAEAFRYYRLEADNGAPLAQFYVGVGYRDGHGVARDLVEAHKWLNVAAALAPEDTMYGAARDGIEHSMTADAAREARARAHDWVESHFLLVASTPEADRTKQALLTRVDGRQP